MTWTRKQLKEQAKEALERNYWKIVLVSFLAMLFCDGLFGAWSSSGNSGSSVSRVSTAEIKESDVSAETAAEETVTITLGARPEESTYAANASFGAGIVFFIMIALFALALMYALYVLLIFPFRVGVSRFMLKSIDDTAKVKEIAYGFDHSYKNIIKTMFHYDIRIFLWTLLFIIPGFYKQYQYRMVPYILAEHPDMYYRDVLKKSSQMMDGHKWNAFILDLSFLLWHIGGLITCGILEVFYVIPYQDLTCAALYRTLSGPEIPPAPLAEPLPEDMSL